MCRFPVGSRDGPWYGSSVDRSRATRLRRRNAAHAAPREVLMPFRVATGVTFAVLFMFPSPGRAQVLTEHDVSLRMALTIAETALAECRVKTSVAVVGRTGPLRGFLQCDRASPHDIELA